MAILNKGLWYVLGALALALAISVSAGLFYRGEAKVLRADLNATQADLKGLKIALTDIQTKQKAQVRNDVRQSNTRAKQAQAVRAVRAKLQKELPNANDSHVASAAELDGLRELVKASNASIRTASELP